MGDSGVQAYMNKSTIIVKVQGNGSSAFKSGEERFKSKKGNAHPGPGYYDYDLPGKGFKAKEPVSGFIEDLR